MMEISFMTGEIRFTVAWIIIRIFIWNRKKRIDWKHETMLILMYVNLFVIIRYAFFPFGKVNGRIQPLIFDLNNIFPFRINIEPFIHLSDYSYKKDMWINILGNFALFIPTGIILPIIYKRLNSFLSVVFSGRFMSLCIELIQLPFSTRTTDIDDLILNTLGVLTGYIIYRRVKLLKNG